MAARVSTKLHCRESLLVGKSILDVHAYPYHLSEKEREKIEVLYLNFLQGHNNASFSLCQRLTLPISTVPHSVNNMLKNSLPAVIV